MGGGDRGSNPLHPKKSAQAMCSILGEGTICSWRDSLPAIFYLLKYHRTAPGPVSSFREGQQREEAYVRRKASIIS